MSKEIMINVGSEETRKRLYETIVNWYKYGYEFKTKWCYDWFYWNIANKTKSSFEILNYELVDYEDELFENNILIITFYNGEYVDMKKITLIRKNESFELPKFKSGEHNND